MQSIRKTWAVIVFAIVAILFGILFWLIAHKESERRESFVPAATKTTEENQSVESQKTGGEKILYENKEFGFSLELPESWKEYSTDVVPDIKVTGKESTLPQRTVFFDMPSKEQGKPAPVFSVSAIPTNQYDQTEKMCSTDRMKQLLDSEISLKPSIMLQPGEKPSRADQARIDKGELVAITSEEDNQRFTCEHRGVFLGRNDAYAFAYQRTDKVTDYPQEFKTLGYFDQADEMIKSFKVTVNTADWKTYRNEKYGFGFKYPAAWESFSVRETDPCDALKQLGNGSYEHCLTTTPEKYLYFDLPTSDPEWLRSGVKTYTLFAVAVYPENRFKSHHEYCESGKDESLECPSDNAWEFVRGNGVRDFMMSYQGQDRPKDDRMKDGDFEKIRDSLLAF